MTRNDDCTNVGSYPLIAAMRLQDPRERSAWARAAVWFANRYCWLAAVYRGRSQEAVYNREPARAAYLEEWADQLRSDAADKFRRAVMLREADHA